MAKAQLSGILRHLGELRETHAVTDASDAELLGRFADPHEETAFAGLLRRHGPMVWAVSRRVLPAVQDAEDVFQAAFLLLARKAASIRKRESVGSWLHGVALHLALKARTRGARRQAHEKRAADMRNTRPRSETIRQEVQEALDRARALVACAPTATATIKRLFDEATSRPRSLRGAAAVSAAVRVSDEAAEGMKAFLEKRRPAWAAE